MPDPFGPSITLANLFDPGHDPVNLGSAVPYTGKRLFCRADAAGDTIAFHVSDQVLSAPPCPLDGRPEVLAAIPGGPFTHATIDVTYEDHSASAGPVPITYFGNPFTFNLRFDANFKIAAAYITEIPPGTTFFEAITAELDARTGDVAAVIDPAPNAAPLSALLPDAAEGLAASAESAAEMHAKAVPPRSHQIFFVAVKDDQVAKLPFKAVFIQNKIVVPPGKESANALIPKEDGGSEHGPMGLPAS